jgi:hypothetical protein
MFTSQSSASTRFEHRLLVYESRCHSRLSQDAWSPTIAREMTGKGSGQVLVSGRLGESLPMGMGRSGRPGRAEKRKKGDFSCFLQHHALISISRSIRGYSRFVPVVGLRGPLCPQLVCAANFIFLSICLLSACLRSLRLLSFRHISASSPSLLPVTFFPLVHQSAHTLLFRRASHHTLLPPP